MARSGFLNVMGEILDVPMRTFREDDAVTRQLNGFGIEPNGGLSEAETVVEFAMVLQRRGSLRE
jgi:hypothetical protein